MERSGKPAGLAIRLRRLGVASGLPFVEGDRSSPHEVVAPSRVDVSSLRLGYPAVKQTAAGQRYRLECQLADRTVHEVQAVATVPDQSGAPELVDCVDRLQLASSADRANGARLVRPPDHRAGREDLGSRLRNIG